jgi:hypothetical protein
MVEIGKINILTIKRNLENGVHLDGGEPGDVFLPKKYLRKNYQLGEQVEVFVFVDKEEHLRATTQIPKAIVGQFAKLRVAAVSSAGAYLDWGLQKDLLVPKSEQYSRMVEGKSYVVYVFLDEKSNRITASSKLDNFLSILPPDYEEGGEVDLLICDKTELGYKAIVNNSHWGIIYENEVFQKIIIGQQLKGYIKKIREDHKIDLSLQKLGHQRVDDVSQGVFEKIRSLGGRITVTDKSPPEEIYSLFGVSKKTFKKAIGALYKRRLIVIDDKGINLVKQ